MKLFFLLIPALLSAQTLVPSAPSSIQRGSSFTLNLVTTGGTLTAPVGVQWTLTLPSGWTATAPTTLVPNKTIACATGNLRCIVYSATTNVAIANGNVASVTIAVPANATLGTATVTTTATLGVSTTGAPITTAGGSATITVNPDARDLNSDGVVDQSDVTAAVSQIFGTCTTADIAPPTGCDVVDLVLITLKAQGLIP